MFEDLPFRPAPSAGKAKRKPFKALIEPKGLLLPPGPFFGDFRVSADFRNGLTKALGTLDRGNVTAVLCSILILCNQHGETLHTRGELGFYTALKYALETEGAVLEALEAQVGDEADVDLDMVCLVPLEFTVKGLTQLVDKLVEARRQHLVRIFSREPKSLLIHFIDTFRWSAYDKWEMHPTLHRPLPGEGWREDGSYWFRPQILEPRAVYPTMWCVQRLHPPGTLAQRPDIQARLQEEQEEEDFDLDEMAAQWAQYLAEEDDDVDMDDVTMEDADMDATTD
ncbi:hypothetical protein MAPG_11566 [Magnaporthiopsis poae ATCC 64411]|uniref:Uncharacterized protein n=1 Tax=Magnaporthiopsis poae (strain ATCC 64411 / 73-15) TaxID=644358 RepID=A0A0C4EFL5_MAGP6|nr:hypothetical protein MAPG_11566 [Magnaporthiopsis poae ATCC 64411]